MSKICNSGDVEGFGDSMSAATLRRSAATWCCVLLADDRHVRRPARCFGAGRRCMLLLCGDGSVLLRFLTFLSRAVGCGGVSFQMESGVSVASVPPRTPLQNLRRGMSLPFAFAFALPLRLRLVHRLAALARRRVARRAGPLLDRARRGSHCAHAILVVDPEARMQEVVDFEDDIFLALSAVELQNRRRNLPDLVENRD